MDPFAPEGLGDPDAVFAELRRRDPVHWSDELGAWVLTRHRDVRAALHDPKLSSRVLVAAPGAAEASDDFASTYTFVDRSLVFSDPPDHTRLRRLVGRAFVPGAIEPLGEVIADQTTAMLDAAGDDLDVVRDLAEPLPIAVLGSLLGMRLDADAGRRLKVACDDFLIPWGRSPETLSPAEWSRAQDAGRELSQVVDVALDRRSAGAPQDDVVARLVAGEAEDHLTRQELFANIVLFLIAGHENLTSLLGVGALLLMTDSDGRRAVVDAVDHHGRWPLIVDELLRLVTPNQFIRRQAVADTVVCDQVVRAGQGLVLILAAANRDPERFPDPDRFQLGRPARRDLAMGQGLHYCLGAPMARLEASVALRIVFERYPALTLRAEPVRYVDNFNVRLLERLPVRV